MLEIVRREQEKGELLGVIVQLGGQTPLKLAEELQAAGVPVLGTSPDSIDLAEDRERFAALVQQLGLKQPQRHGKQAAMRPFALPNGSAIQCFCGPPMFLADGGWRSSRDRNSSIIISRPRSRYRARARC